MCHAIDMYVFGTSSGVQTLKLLMSRLLKRERERERERVEKREREGEAQLKTLYTPF